MKKLFFKSKVLDRIEEAREDSPITLFFDKSKTLSSNGLAVVFTRTVATQDWIKKGYYDHLGDFWKGSNTDEEVRDIVAKAFEEDLKQCTGMDHDEARGLVGEYLC